MSPAHHFAFVDVLNVLDSLPVGIAMLSPQGTVLHCNKKLAALTGFTAERAKGLPCRHVLRSRPCVAGCPLGCSSFGASHLGEAANGTGAGSGAAHPGIPVDELGGADFTTLGGLETDILTLHRRKIPVRLTHFPVIDKEGNPLFYLDVIEDQTEVKLLEQRLQQAGGSGKFVGRSPAVERITALLPSLAASDAPVLLTGETGTGKDVLAETLHFSSPRSREPFVRVNASPMPAPLLAAELFGSANQTVTGKLGRFQQAAGGTLYFTELADIPQALQSQLIRFLDDGVIIPSGGAKELPLNVRLMVATNRDPLALVEDGSLSPELYYRLNRVRLHLPPLRERREDIDFLLQHFLTQFTARFKKSISGFSPHVRGILAQHDYPGNVRELRNTVEYAVMVCPEGIIDLDSLPANFMTALPPQSLAARPATAKKQAKGSRA